MLYNGSEVVRDLEWVIFDEVHYINDAEVLRLHVFSWSQQVQNIVLMETFICQAYWL